MRIRLVVTILLGVLIAGSIAAPLINSECQLCSGSGRLACSACGGGGVDLHFFLVECPCGGAPDCPLCGGIGFYPQLTTKPCAECDGKGGIRCPACGGDGKRNLLERIPDLWREKPKQQE